MEKNYYTVKEVAERIGVTENYVRDLLKRSQKDSSIKLKGIKCGKEWRVSARSLNNYLGILDYNEVHIKDMIIKQQNIEIQALKNRIKSMCCYFANGNSIFDINDI